MTKKLIIPLFILSIAVFFVSAQTSFPDELRNLLDEDISDDEPGIVLSVMAPNAEAEIAIGLANLEADIPVQVDDRFRIGSITKTFIAVIMLQLQEEDVLKLDDLASDWLDESLIEQIPNGNLVTLRQLLNMTSGIPDYLDTDAFLEAIDETPGYPWTAVETLTFIYDEAPLFEPGDVFEYSNSNYNLLQLIIEEATGQPLANVLNERIFEPIGMSSSYLEDPNQLGEGIVRGYEPDDDTFVDITMINDGAGMADGGIISTAADMQRFAQALIDGTLLSDEAFNEMMSTTIESDNEYGLGLDVIESPDGGQIIGHSGSTGGFQSILYIDLQYEISVVGLTNNFDSDVLSFDLADAVMELVVEFE